MNPKLRKFIPVVEAIAALSKNPKRTVGAVIFTQDLSIVATGYNDLSKGIPHLSLLYKQPDKAMYMAHAEENAIAQAAKLGHATLGCIMLTTGLQPCATCARLIVQAGIAELYFPETQLVDEKWADNFAYARNILTDGGVACGTY